MSPPIELPDRRKAAYVLGIGLLVCGLSLLFAPGLSGQVSHDDASYEAVMAIEDHAAETDREYPNTFVLSEWGDNRMYNYHVNGEAESYNFARSNFDEFRFGDDPDGHYDQFEDRVGYVVITDVEGDPPAASAQVQLLDELGAGESGLAHYQLLTVDTDRSVAAFAVVPGATIEGTAEANETVTVSTDVSVGAESFSDDREVVAGADGQFAVTVPYAGEYVIDGERVTVTDDDVEDGETIAIGAADDSA